MNEHRKDDIEEHFCRFNLQADLGTVLIQPVCWDFGYFGDKANAQEQNSYIKDKQFIFVLLARITYLPLAFNMLMRNAAPFPRWGK